MSEDIKTTVKESYGRIARQVAEGAGESTSCCGSSCACSDDPISGDLYTALQTEGLPDKAVLASLGCGNPTALAELHPGETVLDLGSGGGIDVFLSARRVGPEGKVYGLDMTDEMLELARRNQAEVGIENVEFLKGEIENIPLPDQSVDVIISNCVINLSTDKEKVMREAWRVLKPGGRLAISDIVARGNVPQSVRNDLALWTGCIAGSLEEDEFLELMQLVGFEDGSIEPTKVYRVDDVRAFLSGDSEALARELDGKFMGAFVRATKPTA